MELAQMSATDSSDCSSLLLKAFTLELWSVSTPSVWPKEIKGMLMRERDSVNNRNGSGALVRSFSMTVPLLSSKSHQGCWVTAKRPPAGKQGVISPWTARMTNSPSPHINNETCDT